MDIRHIYIALLGMALLSCTSEALEDARLSNELLNVEREVELTAVETERMVEISADCYWEVNVEKSQWNSLTVQPMSGNGNGTIKLNTDANTSISPREAQLTITSAGGLCQKITVRQTLGGATLEVSRTNLSFDAVPTGSQTFTVTSNTTWNIPAVGSDWLTVEPLSGGEGTTVVTVTAAEIQDDRDRDVTLTVALGVGTETRNIQVTQAGKTNITLNLSPDQLNVFDVIGGEQTISITCNARWYADMQTNDWLTLSATEGVGNGSLTFSCPPNYTTDEHKVRVSVSAGSRESISLLVVQEAGKLPEITSSLAMMDNTLSSSGASFTFGYESMFPLTDYGICYSTTNATPTIDDTCISFGEGSTANPAVVVAMTDLTPYTDYYVRAYVKSLVNNGEVRYSTIQHFQTMGMEPSGGDNPYPELGRSKK